MPRVIYHPPSLTKIARLVNEVFDRHSHEQPSLDDPDVRQGFISFLWTVGKILAKQRSEAAERDSLVDTDRK